MEDVVDYLIVMDEVQDIMKHFENSYISKFFEVILFPKTNAWFNIKNCKSRLDVRYKTLIVACRDCFKTRYYKQLKRNEKMWSDNLKMLNTALGTNFSRDDIELVYSKFGNGVREELGKKFVASGYDMEILRSVKDDINKRNC